MSLPNRFPSTLVFIQQTTRRKIHCRLTLQHRAEKILESQSGIGEAQTINPGEPLSPGPSGRVELIFPIKYGTCQHPIRSLMKPLHTPNFIAQWTYPEESSPKEAKHP
jgi:hypothetical protein